jgi:hypothetical protein
MTAPPPKAAGVLRPASLSSRTNAGAVSRLLMVGLRYGSCDDDKAHRFVEYHCLQRRKPKRTDQQRQPKFRAT